MHLKSRTNRLLLTACVAFTAHALHAQSVNPDPELFDGTRTKKEQEKIQQDAKKATDKWEDANLILYDSNEQGSAEGGQGRAGGQEPGYADGAQGGASVQAGLPMPPMGGGAGQGQGGGMPPPIPMGGGAGSESNQPIMAGVAPAGAESSPTANGPSAQGGPPGGKPGEVPIGDPNQRIATTAQPVNKIQGGVPPPPTGEPIQKSKGEDTSTIPNSASGTQSGQRGGGVEKGDAMPTDI